MKKKLLTVALVTTMVISSAISAFAADEATYYFVDCGDFDTSTVSDGDEFGIYNSVTEQLYGTDANTGKKWGLVDGDYSQSGSYDANYTGTYGIRTQWTWANEWCPAIGDIEAGTAERDGHAKEFSNRYTRDMVGNAPVEMTYKFELPDGTYNLEIGFWNSWSNAGSPSIYVNGTAIAENYDVAANNLLFTGEASVTGGEMTLNVKGGANDLCVILSYIKIVGEAPDTTVDEDVNDNANVNDDTNTNESADNNANTNENTNTNTNNNTSNNTTPDTGDSSNVLALSLLGLISAVIVLKKKTIFE